MKANAGFSLIEIIIFILIAGLLSAGLFGLYIQLGFHLKYASEQTHLLEFAEQRMELILGQKQLRGYANFTDPCDSQQVAVICKPPSRYIVKRVTPATLPLGDKTLSTLITVEVTDTLTNNIFNLKTVVNNG